MGYLKSTRLDDHHHVRHGFFTRTGGVSGPPYDDLNCAPTSGDYPACVETNRCLVADAMDIGVSQLCSPRQVHSSTALTLTSRFEGERPTGDAVVTRTTGLGLSVLGADCAPVLFSDSRTGVIAAAHAGWQGALNGILESTVDAMRQLGARARDTVAAVGPCIHQPSYEIGPEFRQRFVDADNGYSKFFAAGPQGKWHFDLPGFVTGRLHDAGVGTVDCLKFDTCADESRFFSYRRATLNGEPDYGRQISVIVVRR